MSPEIVMKKDHNNKIDIWCLGILLYEMLHGKPPFSANNLREIERELGSKDILIKKSLRSETKALLSGMLRSREGERLDIKGVLEHRAFNGLLQGFGRPLDKKFFGILKRNFVLNSGGGLKEKTLPDFLVKDLGKKKLEDLKNNFSYKNFDKDRQNNIFNFNNKKFINSEPTKTLNNKNFIKKITNIHENKNSINSKKNKIENNSKSLNTIFPIKKNLQKEKIPTRNNLNSINSNYKTQFLNHLGEITPMKLNDNLSNDFSFGKFSFNKKNIQKNLNKEIKVLDIDKNLQKEKKVIKYNLENNFYTKRNNSSKNIFFHSEKKKNNFEKNFKNKTNEGKKKKLINIKKNNINDFNLEENKNNFKKYIDNINCENKKNQNSEKILEEKYNQIKKNYNTKKVFKQEKSIKKNHIFIRKNYDRKINKEKKENNIIRSKSCKNEKYVKSISKRRIKINFDYKLNLEKKKSFDLKKQFFIDNLKKKNGSFFLKGQIKENDFEKFSKTNKKDFFQNEEFKNDVDKKLDFFFDKNNERNKKSAKNNYEKFLEKNNINFFEKNNYKKFLEKNPDYFENKKHKKHEQKNESKNLKNIFFTKNNNQNPPLLKNKIISKNILEFRKKKQFKKLPQRNLKRNISLNIRRNYYKKNEKFLKTNENNYLKSNKKNYLENKEKKLYIRKISLKNNFGKHFSTADLLNGKNQEDFRVFNNSRNFSKDLKNDRKRSVSKRRIVL